MAGSVHSHNRAVEIDWAGRDLSVGSGVVTAHGRVLREEPEGASVAWHPAGLLTVPETTAQWGGVQRPVGVAGFVYLVEMASWVTVMTEVHVLA